MPSLVQSASASGTSGTSLAVTLGSPVTAGNCLVACAGATMASVNPTVSGVTLGGSSADNWAAAETAYSSSDANAAIWADPGCAGGATSVTISLAGGSGGFAVALAWVMEWSGIVSVSPVDAVAAGNGNSGTWSSGTSGTTAQPSEVVIGCACAQASPAGPGAPWTNLAVLSQANSIITDYLIAGYQVASAAGTFTYSGTVSSAKWGAALVTLRAAASNAPAYGLLVPPGLSSPMALARQAWPVAPPFTVSSGDAGSGADAGSGGQLGSPGQPLIPPGFSPMAFAHRPAWQPQSLPLAASTDAGTGADAGTVQVTGADTGAGADAGLVGQEADTGAGTDAGTVTATVAGADAGSGAESSSAVQVTGADAGTGAEGSGITARTLLMVRWKAPDKVSLKGDVMQ